MTEDVNISLSPKAAHSGGSILRECSRVAGIPQERVSDMKVISRSIDARKKNIRINLKVRIATDGEKIEADNKNYEFTPVCDDAPSVIIVGAGPAGLFAALECIRLGMRPVILERGKDVDSRRVDLARINKESRAVPESNYCFGEGGAGAYSDGKLYTRSKKRGDVQRVLQLLHQHGASQDILIDAHPHIGTDKLPEVIKNIRKTITGCGGEMNFNSRVDRLIIDGKSVKGAVTSDGKEFTGPVILATGHSARDTYRMLHEQGAELEPKALAIGVRVEHPQHDIDCIQYHSPEGRGKYLPAAEYSFVTQQEGRGVYSFCMCPGGFIVPAVSSEGELVVNGMSPSNRGTRWANSGIVVEVRPGDFPDFTKYGVFEMLEVQQYLEKRFFEAAGETLRAPAQRLTDFIAGKDSSSLPESSYAPGVSPARVDKLLPPFISRRLRQGLAEFGSKAKGFVTEQAAVIGLESRTSSPVRIPRDKETLKHISLDGLYPAGEGAGYAGGIVSAAIDGQRCARSVYESLRKPTSEKE